MIEADHEEVPRTNRVLRPRSVAVVGASERPGSIGTRLFKTLQQGGYRGRLYPVNPHAISVGGLPAYRQMQQTWLEVGPVDELAETIAHLI